MGPKKPIDKMYSQMSSNAIDLVTHLSFISQIVPKYKVNVKQHSVVGSDSSIGSIVRYINGESRYDTINYIKGVITKVIETTPKEDITTQICLIESLRKSIEGINNLKVTYENDIYYIAELSSEIIRIEHFIKWISNVDKHHESISTDYNTRR